jgi:hypothetical protein
MARRLNSCLLILLLGCSVLEAQSTGNWTRVDATAVGTPLTISLKSGMVFEGFKRASAPDDFTIVLPNGNDMKIAKSDVREVRSRSDDGNKNGTLIGTGIGMGLVGIAAAADPMDRAFVAAAAVVYGGVGALLGYVIDNLHKNTDVLYRMP